MIKFVSDFWHVGYSGDVYTIQHYVIKFVSDLWPVGYSGDVYTIQHYVIKFVMCTRYNIM